jgi:geranyl-CoA carboxylase beta subunit
MVMSIVAEGQAKAAGVEPDRAALKKQEARLTDVFNRQASGFYTSGHMMDDGMIDPRDTRRTLGFLLATVWEGRARAMRPNSFGIARM